MESNYTGIAIINFILLSFIGLMFNLFNQFFQGLNLNGLNFEEFMDEPEPNLKDKPIKEPNKKEESTPPLKTIRI